MKTKIAFLCHPLFVVLMTGVMMLAGSVLGSFFTGLIAGVCGVSEEHLWILASYLPFIGIAALVLLFTRLTRKDIFALYFGGQKGNNLKMLGLGAVTGFAMNGVCILAAYLHGDVRFEGGNISAWWLIVSFVVVFIQSATEELLVRGYLYQHIRAGRGVGKAMIASSLLFSLLHATNPGVTVLALVNIAAIALFFTLCVEYLDSLWFAMANHAMWNFTQNFLFGLPNSGLAATTSLLKPKAALGSLMYNVDFGVEAAFPAAVVCLAAAGTVYYIWRRRKPALAPASKDGQ